MAISNIWSAKSGSTTQSCAAWGMRNLVRKSESQKTGELTFIVDGQAVDSNPLFAIWSAFTLYRQGTVWFQGIVTDIKRVGTWNSESVQYTISDPWFWLENIAFQQQWVTMDNTGGAGTLETTTRSRVIVNQGLSGVNLPGVKMDLGQVMRTVLYYALYACQGLPFPATVDADSLPPAPSPGSGSPPPFQIGLLTPTLTVPYFEVKDKSCAEIIKMLLRFVPDTVTWFNFTTTPPTLNIDQRANLAPTTVAVLDGTRFSEFNPNPCYKLQVPAVIAKYEATDSIDQTSYDDLIVDQYPPDVLPNVPRALVQTIDLVGGHATFQKQSITVQGRPLTGQESDAMDWLEAHCPDLVAQYDVANMSIIGLTTTIKPGDPILSSPYLFPSNGSGLDFELINGNIQEWMWDTASVVAAEADMVFQLTYSGTDARTMALVSASGGALYVKVTTKLTNASTEVYQEEVSFQEQEEPPIGNSEILYNILSKLHQQGRLKITEQECSGLLPVGCIFNTSDGLAEWQTMDALVLSVSENIDGGTTDVEFGPTLNLGLQTMAELYRATQTLYAWHLLQRTNAQSTSGNLVEGHTHSPGSSSSILTGQPFTSPFEIHIRAITGGNYEYLINLNSNLTNLDGSKVTLTGLNTWTAYVADTWLYLYSAVATLGLSGAGPTIKNDNGYNPNAALWGADSRAENDGATPPNQTLFRYPIAYCGDITASGPAIIPYCNTNLVMKNQMLGNYPAIYPVPTS